MKRYYIRIAVSLPLALGLSTLTMLGSAEAESAPESSSPVALSGEFPSAVTKVTVSAVPSPTDPKIGQVIRDFVITDAAVTLEGRHFEVRVDPASLPSYLVQADGLVDFKVYGEVNDEAFATSVSARLSSLPAPTDTNGRRSSALAWVDPVESAAYASGKAVPAGRSKVNKQFTMAALLGDEVLTEPEVDDEGVVVDDAVFAEIEPRAAACYSVSRSSKTVSATIGTTYPIGLDTAALEVSSSQGASYGIASSVSGDYGTFSTEGSKFIKSDWGKIWTKTSDMRSYRKGLEYTLYQQFCGTIPMPAGYYWKPTAETGGTSTNLLSPRPSFGASSGGRCASVDPGLWWRSRTDGKAYVYGAGVKIKSTIGIDLSVRRDYSSTQKLEYNILRDNKEMCGNNDWPSIAGKVAEYYR